MWVYSSAVVVSNRKKAVRWYREKLGLSALADDDEHWTTVGRRGKGGEIHLCEKGSKVSPREAGNSGILFLTDENIEKLHAKLSKKGVKFTQPPKHFPWGWVAKFRDPDGNVFWLMPTGD